MGLPKIEYPLFEIYIKSLDKKVKFRPFLVREEKLLLIAKESKDIEEITLAIEQIISNCVSEEIDVSALPIFDIEMIFLKLRARSIGESVKLVFNCVNETESEGEEPTICNHDNNYSLDLNKVLFEDPPGHDPKIMLTDTVGLRLKYPTLSMDMKVEKDDPAYVNILKTLVQNIDYIFDEDSVYKPEDLTKEELLEFLQGITIDKMALIRNFFKTSPKVVLVDEVVCEKCGFKHTIRNEDLLSFFI